MIDPRTVMVAIPCYQGQVTTELVGMLVNYARFGAISMPTECSHVALARNLIAATFMSSPFEWLLGIDADIVPTSLRDFHCLLEPVDLGAHYAEDFEGDLIPPNTPPRPSRVITALTIDPEPGQIGNFDNKFQGAADMLVTAEYAYKQDVFEPVKLGMGFVRIHRSVFERLEQMTHEAGSMVEIKRECVERLKELVHYNSEGQPFTAVHIGPEIHEILKGVHDPVGTPRLWSGRYKGRTYWDYFPSGPVISQYVPTAEWKGEDHGFFTLCYLAGIVARIETRTRLLHMGRKAYPYLGPDAGGGQ